MASSIGSSVFRWNIAPPRPKVHRELHTPTKVRLPIIRFRLKNDLELEKIVKEAGLKASDRRVLYDSEIADVGVRDFMERRKEFAKSVDGPPRWFSPMECGRPPPDVPLLLYLPALVKFVEKTVRLENSSAPRRPVYLVGDSFGGCLALSVAARNPDVDIVLLLANPMTSFSRSWMQCLLPFSELIPGELKLPNDYLLSFLVGDLSWLLTTVLDPSYAQQIPVDGLAKDFLMWRLKMLRAASSYANARLHAVKSEGLVLASGKDQFLPSREEADRLCSILSRCRFRYFKDSGHSIFLDDDINLVSTIKSAGLYRRSRKLDYVSDFLPPTLNEFRRAYEPYRWIDHATSPVMLSKLESGKIVRSLDGIPLEGPVLLVGYHMLFGWEVSPLVREFLMKGILIRGIAHPFMFEKRTEKVMLDETRFDPFRALGAVPVSATGLFKLLSQNSHVLLYPGGVREALHRKGEEYKLFWPEQSEFVRMAARFGAAIVPFAAVGEDDLCELLLDYDDLVRIPTVKYLIDELNRDLTKLRTAAVGELGQQALHVPVLMPKIPGRMYYLFGKPIETKGREELLRDRKSTHLMYLHVKSEVEKNISYLLQKRKYDPYRTLPSRVLYQAIHGPTSEVPTFSL
ncbi:phytyl ester synthase 1, chloroplastic-like isoform X2 [Nymphaea colorata]|uniref:phytyl ester synthase 1, chloroplastic-like isoform X2 n=1 Tax=Nymphaea colorata TaxID=210225 RepID=UPI00214F1886|nr:phytyl ester synthase 1, chloroplastic-like isoform X2 [Nymphaea colorata]